MSNRLLFNKPSNQLVIDLINFQNNTTLAANQIDFSAPTTSLTDLGDSGKNTRVRLIGQAGSSFQGSAFVFYNRLALNLLHDSGVVGVLGNFTNQAEALARFNLDYGLGIQLNELVPAVLNADGSIDFTISESLVYQPSSKVTVVPLSTLSSFEGWVDRFWFYTNYTLRTHVTF